MTLDRTTFRLQTTNTLTRKGPRYELSFAAKFDLSEDGRREVRIILEQYRLTGNAQAQIGLRTGWMPAVAPGKINLVITRLCRVLETDARRVLAGARLNLQVLAGEAVPAVRFQRPRF